MKRQSVILNDKSIFLSSLILCTAISICLSCASTPTYEHPKGEIYEGQIKNGYRHGEGILTYAGGSKYVGQWKNDKFHGEGTMYDQHDKVYQKGTFEYGQYIGQ